MDAETLHRLQFAFTITYHYLFPQLTMGLALLIVIFKTRALRGVDAASAARNDRAARFWGKIFAVNFGMGVVTGIPMEFQFGTNWARFTEGAGSVIGQTLAMEGVFSFFLESTFLGLFLFGEKRLGPKLHWLSAVLVFLGAWLSGFFIVATNAWMQHPVGYSLLDDGSVRLESLSALFTNPWLPWQYAHTMIGSIVTASVVVSSIGAAYLLLGRHREESETFLRLGVPMAFAALVLAAFPTGDQQARNVAIHQPAAFAGMEGLFDSEEGAPLTLIGQPNMEAQTLDNPIHIPKLLSFLTYQRWDAEIQGLKQVEDEWPDNVPMLYYAYHIMVGLGTMLLALFGLAAWRLRGGKLFEMKAILYALVFALPFPYIANTAGWLTAELGRQPWLVYKVLRTGEGYSDNVSAGNTLFTLIGFAGMYALLTLIFLLVVGRQIARGPHEGATLPAQEGAA